MRPKLLLLWLGLALAWAGYWAPWIAHRSAALNWNGYELAEWITRLPGVRDGTLRLGRLDFMLPLAAISLMTALAANATPDLSGWLRWPARLLALLGGFLILPEYPFILTAPTDPELRPTLVLGVVVMVVIGGLVIGSLIEGRSSRVTLSEAKGLAPQRRDSSGALRPQNDSQTMRSRIVGATISLPALVALVFMVRSLIVVWPPLAELFHAPVRLNWGPVVLGAGAGLALVAGAIETFRETFQPKVPGA